METTQVRGTEMQNLSSLFEPIVGPEHVRVAEASDAVDGCQPQIVVAPGSSEEIAAVLRVANDARLHVIPRGGGTKLAWGNVPDAADVVVSTARLNRLLEHAHGDMTATVEAGMTLSALQEALSAHGQLLALDPPWPEHATIGGIIAADASGSLRVRYSTMRDLLLGVEVALSDGTLARSGGKVVKNVAGYDLMKLFTGSLGTLGVITSATVRLHPLPATSASLYLQATTAAQAQAIVLELNASTLTPTGVQIISAEQGYGICVRFAGVAPSVAAQSERFAARAHEQGLPVHVMTEMEAHAAWQAQTPIYTHSDDAVVGRVSVLPSSIGATIEAIEAIAHRLRLVARVLLYSTGTGFVRFEGDNEQALLAAIVSARARIVEGGGHLVMHLLPAAIKPRLDVWGAAGDALPLMRRVKTEFDPHGIMNPGRYIGRI